MDNHGGIGFDGDRHQDQVARIKLPLRTRWVLLTGAARIELGLIWAVRCRDPRRWIAEIRIARAMKREVQDGLDQLLIHGDGDVE